jgi:glycosyltransferase involved in cell wall biosynthesis
MAKVAIDIRTSHPSGIYRYGSSLLGHLVARLSLAGMPSVVLYGPNLEKPQVISLAESVAPHDAELLLVPDEVNFGRDSVWLREWLVRHDVNLYYSFNYIVDVRCPVPYIFTIYDLIRLKHPHFSYTDASFRRKFGEQEFLDISLNLKSLESYVPLEVALDPESHLFTKYFWAMMRYQAEQSFHIVTISEAVKSDIMRMLEVSSDKVSVVPGSTHQAQFHPRQRAEVDAVLEKYNFNASDPYCLYVGANPPHKRLPWLIEILSRCVEKLPPRAKLLIAGKYRTDNQSLEELIRRCGLDKVVVFTGQVTDDELACLYSGARALLVSSVDEGFCLPALEALCCGCEVIAPGLEVMSEITSGCGHFYPPDDGEQLAFYLTEAFNARLPQKSLDHCNRFSWAASAEQLSSRLQRTLPASGEQ